MKKYLSAILSASLTVSPLSVGNVQAAEVLPPAVTVSEAVRASDGDTDTSSCYLFDSSTGELILRGNVDKDVIRDLDRQAVLSIRAEKDTVLPGNCGHLFSDFRNCKTIDLSEADTSNVTDMYCMFSDCHEAESIDVSGFDTSNVTDMQSMFAACDKLETLDLSSFDTSKITDLYSFLFGDSALKSIDLSSFDTSNITCMNNMFAYCDNLSSLDLKNFDTSNVLYMDSMFFGCLSLETLDLSTFDTSSLADTGNMFCQCSALTSLDLSSFDMSKIEDSDNMFDSCYSLKELRLGEKFTEIAENYALSNTNKWSNSKDTSSYVSGSGKYAVIKNTGSNTYVRTMTVEEEPSTVIEENTSPDPFSISPCYFFDTVSGELTLKGNVDGDVIRNLDYHHSVKSVKAEKGTVLPGDSFNLFSGFDQCTKIDLSEADTSEVTSMYSMFSDCKELTSLDISSFDTSNVTDMENMFFQCKSLEALDLSNFDMSRVTSIDNIFLDCNSLEKLSLSDTFKNITKDYSLPNYPGWAKEDTPETNISGTDGYAEFYNSGANTYIRFDESLSPITTNTYTTTATITTTSTETTTATDDDNTSYEDTQTNDPDIVKITAKKSQTETVDYGSDPFFIVVGKHSNGMGGESHTQLKFFNIEKDGWFGGDKLVWREAPSDLVYGDILIPVTDTSMSLLDTESSMFPSSYYWDLADGTKLKKIGNCADIMEQKVLTATNFDYLAYMWYGMDYSDGEKSYRYSENNCNSHYEVYGCGSEGDIVRFAVYEDTLLIPLEIVGYYDAETETSTTTAAATTTTTTTTTMAENTSTTNTAPAAMYISVVDKSGEQVSGAVLSLTGTDNDSKKITFTEDNFRAGADSEVNIASGDAIVWVSGTEPLIVMLEDGNYLIHELTAPEGYEKTYDFVFTIANGEAFCDGIELIAEPIEGASTSTTIISTTTISTSTTTASTEETTTTPTETETSSTTTYTVTTTSDVVTTTDSEGENEELPQTGNNSMKPLAVSGLSMSLVLFGVYEVLRSGVFRRKENE